MGKEKLKKRRQSHSESAGSSSDSTSKEKKKLKKLKRKLKKEQRKAEKIMKKKIKAEKKRLEKSRSKSDSSCDDEPVKDVTEEVESVAADIPIELMERSKAMAPMTKEEWDKKQSVIRRVLDEESGRYRLIKGDGEVLEEIVSKGRHKEINRQATRADGDFFQSQTVEKKRH